MEKEYFDFTPHPAFLRVMGKVPFKEWQCVAELIDNSIDAIVKTNSSDQETRTIKVSLPQKSQISKNQPLIVEDFAGGMSSKELEKALSAGDSSKNTVNNLGLFGMGFNLATSKLANTVEVWTSTKDDENEIGARIDLSEMIKEGTFRRKRLSRPKKEGKKSGTEIIIYDYNPSTVISVSKMLKELSRAYSNRIVDELNVTIEVNNRYVIEPFRFCVWNSNRSVRYKHDDIPAVYEFDEVLDEKSFCENCFSWIDSVPDTSLKIQCPSCKESDYIVRKEIAISGWVGIQRFSHPDKYGINISRNGRILSSYDKSLFHWNHPDAEEDPRFHPEYPRDTPAAGGRIVGEIEANFIIPEYTKDDFDREDQNWKAAVEFIRGEMPLQPDLASTFGFKGRRNRSYIGLLFSAYRKVSPPGSKTLVFANNVGKADYITPRNMADKFYDGIPEYQSDELWWQEVTKSDLKENDSTFDPFRPKKPREEDKGSEEKPKDQAFPGKAFHIKNRSFNLEKLLNLRPIHVTLMEYHPEQDEDKPIIFQNKGQNSFYVYLNYSHPLFRDFADEYEDLLLIEVANRFKAQILDDSWTLTRIYYELKSRYSVDSMLNVSTLITKASNLMRDLQNFLGRGEGIPLPTKARLTDTEIKKLQKEYINIENQPLQHFDLLLSTTKYVKFLELNYVFKFIREYPELIFDDNFFALPYSILDDELKSEQLEKYLGYLNDVKWFLTDLSTKSDEAIKKLKTHIIRNKLSLELLYGCKSQS